MTNYSYAVQIQPRTGQEISEFGDIDISSRDWTDDDSKQFPNATRQLWDGAKLIVDTASNEVYAVHSEP